MLPQKTARFASVPWLSDMLTRLVLGSGIGYVAAAYSISRWLTRPSPRRPRLTPTELGLSWEKVECHTADNLRLVGWVVSPPRPRATVVLFHGLRHNREYTLSRTRFLTDANYRCVAFDHRAHGESGGRRSSFGYHESRDVAAILDFVHQRWPAEPRAVLGISMGAAALCYAAEHSRTAHAIILESCYFDISSAFDRRLRNGYPPWYQRLSRGVVWVTERRLGVRLGQLAPAEYIGKLAPTPTLLLTGSQDPHATPADVLRLYEHCGEPREFWLVPHAGHKDVLEAGGSEYQERVLDFLERRLPA